MASTTISASSSLSTLTPAQPTERTSLLCSGPVSMSKTGPTSHTFRRLPSSSNPRSRTKLDRAFGALDDRRVFTLVLLTLAAPAVLWLLSQRTLTSEPASVVDSAADQQQLQAQGEVDADKLRDYSKFRWHDDLRWPKRREAGLAGNEGTGNAGAEAEGNERLIIVGDLHGMVDSFEALLKKVNFRQNVDTLVLVGDLIAKHPSVESSIRTLRRARELGAIGVRGNHDQMVLDWRGWMEDEAMTGLGEDDREDGGEDLDVDMMGSAPGRYPSGWRWDSQHREIAKRLPAKEYRYLLSFPLTLRIPSLHTYIVHAGLLPWSISTYPLPSPSNPPAASVDAALISNSPSYFLPPSSTRSLLSSTPERSLLLVSQNRDPWALTNVRTVSKRGKPSRDGTRHRPWHAFWNEEMEVCAGTDVSDKLEEGREREIPDDCKPVTAVYGHWAGQGLDIRDWSIGLDSGCVYGKRLSALVVSQAGAKGTRKVSGEWGVQEEEEGWEVSRVKFGREGGWATLVNLACADPNE